LSVLPPSRIDSTSTGGSNDSMSVEDRRKLLRVYTSRWDHRSRRGLWPLPIQSNKCMAGRQTRSPRLHGSICDCCGYVRFVKLSSLFLWVLTREWDLVGVPGWSLETHPLAYLVASQSVSRRNKRSPAPSSTSLGTLSASSGFDATSPSALVRRASVVGGVYNVWSPVRPPHSNL